MARKYVDALADCAKRIFEEMAATEVVEIVVKQEERLVDRLAVATVITYRDEERNVDGQFVLGFTDETSATLVASAIAERMGDPPFENCDELAVETLNEFMNTVVGHTITEWEELGLSAHFSPPQPLLDTSILTKHGLHEGAYVVILNLSVGSVVFNVTLTESSKRLTGNKVLVVDDSIVIRGLLSKALRQVGCEVAQARDGEEAKQVFASFQPDLTLMDLVMPRKGGLDAIFEIQRDNPDARFIVLTSSARKDQLVTAKTLNVSAYLRKPVRMNELLEQVKKALSS